MLLLLLLLLLFTVLQSNVIVVTWVPEVFSLDDLARAPKARTSVGRRRILKGF